MTDTIADLNEDDTKATLIEPNLRDRGWDTLSALSVRREYKINAGRLNPDGSRQKLKKADYVLIHNNHIMAVLEAKKTGLHVSEGVEQARDYAQLLNAPYVYVSNGRTVYEINMATGEQGDIQWHQFPTPQQLWQKTHGGDNNLANTLRGVPFLPHGDKRDLRYYQTNAINAVLSAIAHGKKRILLTLATGTGKTTIASQIAHKLHWVGWNLGGYKRDPRILFLADRNILADQAYTEFSIFSESARKRISTETIRKNGGQLPKNGAVFFTIFQTFAIGDDTECEHDSETVTYNFENYAPDFFDFIIVDECHRGGANDESKWRGILDYFAPAVQLGLTATPKRDINGDTYDYFGEPVYTYSLKQGIQDGFLTPYKLQKIRGSITEYTHTADNIVLDGEIAVGETVSARRLASDVTIKEVLEKEITQFLDHINPDDKTIVFCGSQKRAGLVRDMINQMHSTPNSAYCARVTAMDGKNGEVHLENFKDWEKQYPVILTTSQKLSTGVDVRNLRNIVIMRPVNSMIEFKQIVGRGTRLFTGKSFFTIYDFQNAYDRFQDPEWDGEPVAPEPKLPIPHPVTPKPETPTETDGTPDPIGEIKPDVVITLSADNARKINLYQNIFYTKADGTLESAQDILNRLYNSITTLCPTEQDLRQQWQDPRQRENFIKNLYAQGFNSQVIQDIVKSLQKQTVDIFDILAHIAYNTDMITRTQRANACKPMVASEKSQAMQEFLKLVLQQYQENGYTVLSPKNLIKLIELKFTTLPDAVTKTGYEILQITEKLEQCQRHLYSH